MVHVPRMSRRCISFDSYIKPQQGTAQCDYTISCISFDSYIKPQRQGESLLLVVVVYLLTPTSNHNIDCTFAAAYVLYIFWLLHQTTTIGQTIKEGVQLYIFWLLHQTTTYSCLCSEHICCISFDSYIKPQLMCLFGVCVPVVYLLTPTSNHNTWNSLKWGSPLYIFWLLHQTTTGKQSASIVLGCISFDSYIKPQPKVIHLIKSFSCISFDSYIKPQPRACSPRTPAVVYLLTPTSNHNLSHRWHTAGELYIFWLLHQTTTYRFESTEFQRITFTFSNKKWWVGYIFQCKSTKKTPIE